MKYLNCCYAKRLLNKLRLMNDMTPYKVSLSKIRKSICFAKKYHSNQKRHTGEPFYSHPLEVAYMVADHLFQTDMIITAILHDVIEDTILTKEVIANEFGCKIASQVEDLTQIKNKHSSTEIIITLYQQEKYNLLLIKLLDRLHNMQTLEAQPPDKIQEITLETSQIFLPLAQHLNLSDIQKKCIDLAI